MNKAANPKPTILTPEQLDHLRKNNKGFKLMEEAQRASIEQSKKMGEILPAHRS
jgi:hypothetical protein